uniref:Protein kinase domain-containing protein n=1 Tax=Parastrongyloides trichosuri TaxID=131310 RepID=A0A0N5A6E8_PARTI
MIGTQVDSSYSSKCLHTYEYCESWISVITLMIDSTTTEAEFDNIKSIMNKTVVNCNVTQALVLYVYTCDQFIISCVGSIECLENINSLSWNNIMKYVQCNNFWMSLSSVFSSAYLNSMGLSSYIITNLNCSQWEYSDLSYFYKDSNSTSYFITYYSIVTKLIHVTDSDYGGVCIINPIINSTAPLLDVITVEHKNVNQLTSDMFGMCSQSHGYTINLFDVDLDNPSNCTLYTVGIDENKCLSYTLMIYFAINKDTPKDELNTILKLASTVFEKCKYPGTTVIYWSANSNNKIMKCDPSTEACNEKINSLSIYDVSYQNTTDQQIDISSLQKVVSSFENLQLGEATAFYIFSNLENDELSSSLISKPLFNNAFEYGYFLYQNKIITHFVDVSTKNKISQNKFRSLTNAANEYFAFDRTTNLSEQLDGLSISLEICSADVYYINSSTTNKPPPGTNVEIIILIVCGSLVTVIAICTGFLVRCRKLAYKFRLSKFNSRFARDDNDSHDVMEIAHRNKHNKDFQNCLESFNHLAEERYTNCPNGVVNDRYEMSINDLAINYNSRLGSGAFASVYKGFIKGVNPLKNACQRLNVALDVMMNLNNEVAVKTCLRPNDIVDKGNLLGEIKFMKELGYHPHVVNIVGCITDWKQPLLILEYCENEDLLKLLRKQNKKSISEGGDHEISDLKMKDLYSFAWQVADGMVYLASKNIIHRDIAARNILITKNNVAKIGDFGLCRSTEEINYTTKGGKFPIRWMSYEALKYYTFSVKSDVWAYGVLLYEIFTLGEVPYKTVQLYDLVDHLEAGHRLSQPEFCIDEVYDIMRSCWEEDPLLRPTFEFLRKNMAQHLELNSDSYGYIQLLPDFNKIYMEITETMQKPVSLDNESSVEGVEENSDTESLNRESVNIKTT